MSGGIYECEACGYRMGHFSDKEDLRLPCLQCEGWMHPVIEVAEPYGYKKPNLFWRLLWKLIKPVFDWIDRHEPDDEEG